MPVFTDWQRGRYTNAEIRDILRYLLRKGTLPEGALAERSKRQQRNYKYHSFLPEIVQELQQQGVPIDANFRPRAFWKEWRRINKSPLDYASLWLDQSQSRKKA